jgi:hypothetical protein
MVDTGSPFRDTFRWGSSHGGGGDADNYMQDYKEKRKLLVRWGHYFPHENVKEFDVSFSPFTSEWLD